MDYISQYKYSYGNRKIAREILSLITQKHPACYMKHRRYNGLKVWNIGNGDPMHLVCIQHKILRHGNSTSEVRRGSRHKNNSIIVKELYEI